LQSHNGVHGNVITFASHLQAGKAMPAAVRSSVSQIGPQAQAIVEAFGIPDHLVAAPIAGDWERYNRVDNKGELIGDAGKA
jgi:acyl-CoA oxidase